MRYFYIYNFHQTKFFLDNELKIIDIGKGTSGNIYHKFVRDDEAERIFTKWKESKPKVEAAK